MDDGRRSGARDQVHGAGGGRRRHRSRTARDFPLEDVESLVPDETGFGCLAVEGDDLAVVLDAAADATQITPWIVGDATVQLVFSPLYPYETGCA